ncbi:MAG TPA: DUF488 family protein [Nannocystis sp.]
MNAPRIYTIGHSTRSLGELLELLRAFGITVLADIRTVPRSRHNPQFNADTLPSALRRRRIHYVHLPRLGGLRRPRKDSPNTGWHNAGFRGFADYMQTDEFAAGLAELLDLTAHGQLAIMCAESVPWRCHRNLVADALTARGVEVLHITAPARATPHHLTPFARIDASRIVYPGDLDPSLPLPTRAPFHLEATVRVLQRRDSNPVDRWESGRYLRVLRPGARLVLIEIDDRGTVDAPDLRLAIRHGDPSPDERRQLIALARKILGLDLDPAPLIRLTTATRALRPVALALRGMRPPRFAEWFEAFAGVIPFQQVSLDAGAAIVARLVARLGEPLVHDGRRFDAFPTAEAVAATRLPTLRACGLSARKAEALRDLARAIADGSLTEAAITELPTRDALKTLQALPGIGPWSAALILLRGLGRLDVFPPGDVGAQRGLRALLRLAPDAPLAPVVDRFRDHRGYLYFCALGGDLLAKGRIHPAPPQPSPPRRT